MTALALLVMVQLACRLYNQSAAQALASTLFLLLFVGVCHRWGGWTSAHDALSWSKARPMVAWIIGSGVLVVVGLTLHDASFNPASVIAEAIGAYFFFHACCAIGDRLIAAMRHT